MIDINSSETSGWQDRQSVTLTILCGKWLVRAATAAFIHSSNTPKVMTGTQTDESTQQSAQTYGNNTKKQAKITFKLKQVPTNGSHNISMCRIWWHAPKRLEKSSAARVAGITSCCCCRHLLWQVGTRTNLRLGSKMLAEGCFTPAAVISEERHCCWFAPGGTAQKIFLGEPTWSLTITADGTINRQSCRAGLSDWALY